MLRCGFDEEILTGAFMLLMLLMICILTAKGRLIQSFSTHFSHPNTNLRIRHKPLNSNNIASHLSRHRERPAHPELSNKSTYYKPKSAWHDLSLHRSPLTSACVEQHCIKPYAPLQAGKDSAPRRPSRGLLAAS